MNKVCWMQSHPEVTRNELCQDFKRFPEVISIPMAPAPPVHLDLSAQRPWVPHLKTDKWGEMVSFPIKWWENHGEPRNRGLAYQDPHNFGGAWGWSDRLAASKDTWLKASLRRLRQLNESSEGNRYRKQQYLLFVSFVSWSLCAMLLIYENLWYYSAIVFPCLFLSFVAKSMGL